MTHYTNCIQTYLTVVKKLATSVNANCHVTAFGVGRKSQTRLVANGSRIKPIIALRCVQLAIIWSESRWHRRTCHWRCLWSSCSYSWVWCVLVTGLSGRSRCDDGRCRGSRYLLQPLCRRLQRLQYSRLNKQPGWGG